MTITKLGFVKLCLHVHIYIYICGMLYKIHLRMVKEAIFFWSFPVSLGTLSCFWQVLFIVTILVTVMDQVITSGLSKFLTIIAVIIIIITVCAASNNILEHFSHLMDTCHEFLCKTHSSAKPWSRRAQSPLAQHFTWAKCPV